jgi:hypothetical protein
VTALFPSLLGERFEQMPPSVRRMHGGERISASGRAVSAGRGVGAWLVGIVLGAPGRGRYPLRLEIAPHPGGEVWTRWFGTRRLRSQIAAVAGIPQCFEEKMGPISFRLSLRPTTSGFGWVLVGWRLGPLPLPRWLAPTVRASSFEADGSYRFSVVVAHAWLGVVMAYAGRLNIDAS